MSVRVKWLVIILSFGHDLCIDDTNIIRHNQQLCFIDFNRHSIPPYIIRTTIGSICLALVVHSNVWHICSSYSSGMLCTMVNILARFIDNTLLNAVICINGECGVVVAADSCWLRIIPSPLTTENISQKLIDPYWLRMGAFRRFYIAKSPYHISVAAFHCSPPTAFVKWRAHSKML